MIIKTVFSFIRIFVRLTLLFIITLNIFPITATSSEAVNQPSDNTPVLFEITFSSKEKIELNLFAPSYQINKIQIDDNIFDQLHIPGTDKRSELGQYNLHLSSKLRSNLIIDIF